MIQIPDSESDSSGVVADNKDSQQPHPAHALNIEIPTQSIKAFYYYSKRDSPYLNKFF